MIIAFVRAILAKCDRIHLNWYKLAFYDNTMVILNITVTVISHAVQWQEKRQILEGMEDEAGIVTKVTPTIFLGSNGLSLCFSPQISFIFFLHQLSLLLLGNKWPTHSSQGHMEKEQQKLRSISISQKFSQK